MKNRNFGDSFKNALNGIIYTVKNERNMKIHMLAAAGSLFLVFFYRLSGLEAAVICLTVAAVIACELFNTAVEAIVDIIVDVYHPKAKIIKDAAAGAVLVAALLAVLIGYFIFFQRVCGTMDIIMAAAAKMTLWNAAVLFIGAILLTVILKIFIKKSMYLYIKYPDIISALMLFAGVSISFNIISIPSLFLADTGMMDLKSTISL